MSESTNLVPSEERLANVIWREAPLTSSELVALALKELGWKKSTTYTILRKLCEKGIFKNEHTNISVIITHDELLSKQSRHYIEDSFGGSLPRFITSFFGDKKLIPTQAEELIQLIKKHESGGNVY